MSQKVFAEKVAAEMTEYGFDPMTILTLLSLLLPLIQNLPCFKKSQKHMEKQIDGEYRECCKKRAGRCPPRIRQALKREGYTDREVQDALWSKMNKVAFANNQAVAAAMVAA
jgi:hypothetical protein